MRGEGRREEYQWRRLSASMPPTPASLYSQKPTARLWDKQNAGKGGGADVLLTCRARCRHSRPSLHEKHHSSLAASQGMAGGMTGG